MSVIYKGSSLVQGPTVSTWKVGSGGQTRYTWSGKQADIVNKALEMQLLGYETEVTSGPKWTLVATITIDMLTGGGTEPEPVPQWELSPHNIDQSIFESGRPFIKDLPSSVKAAIEAKLKNPQKSDLFVVPESYLNNTAMIEKAMRIYTMKQAGIDFRRIASVSLRRTLVASTSYDPRWSLVNNGCVLSTGALISNYGPPNIIRALMPSSGADPETITFDDVAVKTITLDWYYGWLEQRPSYQTVGVNRIQIAQEWIWNRWLSGNNGLYDVIA